MAHVKEVLETEWEELFRCAVRGISYLYLVQEQDDGPVKIGVSRNAFWRMSDLQAGNFRRLFMRGAWRISDRIVALKLERAVLERFADQRIGGEWMSATPDVVRNFINGRD